MYIRLLLSIVLRVYVKVIKALVEALKRHIN